MDFFKKISTAKNLLLSNPKLFLLYLKKACVENTVFHVFPSMKRGVRQKKLGDIIFEVDFKNLPEVSLYATQILFGFYEIASVEYIKKSLKKGDVFIDVGAHVGYFSAIAASLVGKEGQVHSFEPVPQTFHYLEKIARNNPQYRIFLSNCAIGDKVGTNDLYYRGSSHSGGSSMVPGFLPKNEVEQSFTVPTIRLDDYLDRRGLREISLIKIDAEGYEFNVLKGLQNYFETTSYRPIIVCEINPPAYSLLGATSKQLLDYMKAYGYKVYDIYNPRLEINLFKLEAGSNVIFKPDLTAK